MSQLSQRPSLWIYSALHTALSSRNLESRGSVGIRVCTEKLERLIAGQMDYPNKRTGGWGSHPLSRVSVVPLSELESGPFNMHLQLFISSHSHSLKSNDMSTLLENPSAHPPAYKKGWESERELTFQYHFFQNVHEVLLGNATQGCELWLCYQFQQLWVKIEVARLRIQRYFSPLIFAFGSHDT